MERTELIEKARAEAEATKNSYYTNAPLLFALADALEAVFEEQQKPIKDSQHCTYENDNGDDYTYSHTAGLCGKPQPRRCGCAFCYPE